jgi:hypothetical protein
MPVILDGPGAEAAWLDPGVDPDGALELVRPLPDGTSRSMRSRRGSTTLATRTPI